MDKWKRYAEWEASLPERFDAAKSTPGSDYNLHHLIVEATAEEVGKLLKSYETPSEGDSEPKKGLYLLRIDGGKKASAAGENGEGAIGFVLRDPKGGLVPGGAKGRTIGPVPDPHSAEYEALLAGLGFAQERGFKYIAVFSDSRTLVNQVNNLWKSKDHLKEYCEKSVEMLKSFDGTQVSWVPREWNKEADELVDNAFASGQSGEIIHAEE